ncbi:hypothetical protein BDZ89DRAFT_956657 [Hymenopellis radicata]|nr:hypothetical protein BDZ89DRAFT_956657 [Hymenopellis radicata]
MSSTTNPTIADLLTIEPSVSIFYSYARELQLSSMFSTTSAKLTVLVPTNKAVMALARKPHQGKPEEDHIEISEQEFDSRSRKNVERWIGSHIIQQYPLDLSTSATYDTLIEGKSVHFESQGEDWTQLLIDDGIRIKQVKEASNGVIYVLDGTISVD